MRTVYSKSQLALGGLLVGVGLAMLATAVAGGGGPLSLGVIVGGSFAAFGAARIWLARQRTAEAER
ncbi:MAG: hypothetical protein WD993_05005 [Thermoleophilaceae bacterium]